eukprot:12885753-Prorocentrum_lima.AAC.1
MWQKSRVFGSFFAESGNNPPTTLQKPERPKRHQLKSALPLITTPKKTQHTNTKIAAALVLPRP